MSQCNKINPASYTKHFKVSIDPALEHTELFKLITKTSSQMRLKSLSIYTYSTSQLSITSCISPKHCENSTRCLVRHRECTLRITKKALIAVTLIATNRSLLQAKMEIELIALFRHNIASSQYGRPLRMPDDVSTADLPVQSKSSVYGP